jgi:hypothetical protein
MFEPASFRAMRLPGGYTLVFVEFVQGPLWDAAGRPALARSSITGKEIQISILDELSEEEKSVSIYHEILEAMAVAAVEPPDRVMEFNEGDFEESAYAAYNQYGPAAPDSLLAMLQFYGF